MFAWRSNRPVGRRGSRSTTRSPSRATILGAAADRATLSSAQLEDEVVLLSAIARLQDHLAAGVAVGAGSAGDRHDAVMSVVERSLDGDLAPLEERRPQALPDSLLDVQPRAEALVVADSLLVGRVEHRVDEREDVPLHVLAPAGGNFVVGE